jgi:D-3-phosphoglycerate dehydrogenase / 2-oxoglutarate reductase
MDDLPQIMDKIEYLLVGGRRKIDANFLSQLPSLKMIQRTGVGLEIFDFKAIEDRRIPVYVNSGINSQSVAEHTLMLILATLKRLSIVDVNTRNGVWIKQEQGLLNFELAGKTIGIIGMGNIGKKVAAFIRPFQANVIYYDTNQLDPLEEYSLNISYCTLDKLYKEADVITLHCPLNVKTKNMLSQDSFRKMKAGVIIINTSRGGLIKEEDLIISLGTGEIRFAGLDVFEEEPLSPDSPLLSLPNVILTPHIAGITHDSFAKMMKESFNNIFLFEIGKQKIIADRRIL